MDKPRYRYNWKTGKADRLFRVEQPLTDIEAMIKHYQNMRIAYEIINGETIH